MNRSIMNGTLESKKWKLKRKLIRKSLHILFISICILFSCKFLNYDDEIYYLNSWWIQNDFTIDFNPDAFSLCEKETVTFRSKIVLDRIVAKYCEYG